MKKMHAFQVTLTLNVVSEKETEEEAREDVRDWLSTSVEPHCKVNSPANVVHEPGKLPVSISDSFFSRVTGSVIEK
jgi:hypothetical protein